MLIGLISDTHIPDRARELPEKVIEAFENVELIIHAGDLTSPKVIEELENIAPVMAVQGNMDRVNGNSWMLTFLFQDTHTSQKSNRRVVSYW